MDLLTAFGACAVTIMMVSYALEGRPGWWVGAWPFGVVEAIWAAVAVRRWYQRT